MAVAAASRKWPQNRVDSSSTVSIDPLVRLRDSFAMSAPSPVLILPFILLLAAMALAPVIAPQWWLRHYPKVSFGLGGMTVAVYVFFLHDLASLGHAAHEYAGFIALIGSLYVIAGGIRIEMPGPATPAVNALFLFAGAVAANVLGTTGAAMLLIRPWIQMNQGRVAAYHIAFFIFLVANVGGCLTPIGDPPLFLGYLQGVPFWWVARKCWPMWATGTGLLLAIFFFLDQRAWKKWQKNGGQLPPPAERRERKQPSIMGLSNLFFLAMVVGAVFINHPPFLREGLMVLAALGSYYTTNKAHHRANQFSFHPLVEVAVLFAGVFATMIPALVLLDHRAAEILGPRPGPGIFYWGAGCLSAVLDNAPTYLGFLSALFGVAGANEVSDLLGQRPDFLAAISIGAVFFGAATYIGNGPNFMVKAIAEQRGVPMPSFTGFLLKYSLLALLPVLVAVWLLFFRD
jgi:Na+/H+ antiporter NhaD/arsenite permease-like protein